MPQLSDQTVPELSQEIRSLLMVGNYRRALVVADRVAEFLALGADAIETGELWTCVCRARWEMAHYADAEIAGL